MFSSFDELNSILRKVLSMEDGNPMFDTIVSSQGVVRFSAKFLADNPRIDSELTGNGTGAKIVSNEFETMLNGDRVARFIRRSWLDESEYLDCYKVFVPEANGTGAIGEVLSTRKTA